VTSLATAKVYMQHHRAGQYWVFRGQLRWDWRLMGLTGLLDIGALYYARG